MVTTGKNGARAWGWAFGINLVIFVALWIAFINIQTPVEAGEDVESNGKEIAQVTETPDETTSESPAETIDATGGTTIIELQDWSNEFYLDNGLPISFAPGISNGQTVPSAEDLNSPIMRPSAFSKKDLKGELEVYREKNLALTVRINIDAHGLVQGEPEIVESSGYEAIDQETIRKIMEEATFTPATRIDNKRPVPVIVPMYITWIEG